MKQYFFHIAVAVTALLLCNAGATFAQEGTNKLIRKGNDQYKKQQYADAEASYKKALERNNKSVEGNYNLGNSLYEQKRFDAARTQYANTIKVGGKKELKADANYNIGNTFMEDKKWEESIKSYKNALKANPADEQARYNLAYAQAMLKKQQQEGGGDDKKDNKDKQKDKQKENKENKEDQKKDQDKKEQEKKEQEKKQQEKEQQQQPQPKPSKLTPEEAKRLLQALAQQEKKLQEDKMKKVKASPGMVEKDW